MNTILYQENIKIIHDRWPKIAKNIKNTKKILTASTTNGAVETIIINNLQLSSRYDPVQEAKIQALALPEAEVVTLYGFGMGYLTQFIINNRPETRKIQVVILNIDVFSIILKAIDLSTILSNPIVELLMGRDETHLKYPYFASPPDLQLCDKSSARLRNLISHDNTIKYNKNRFNTIRKEVSERIYSNADLIEIDGDVSAFFNIAKGKKAFIIGAGPTLDQSLHWCKTELSKNERPIIIAVDTALKPLSTFDIVPDLVVSIDMHKREKFYYDGMENTPLIYAPLLANDVLKAWPGPRHTTYFNLKEYETWKSSHPKGTLVCLSSVIHTATDLAVKMGVKEIYFLGADFAFPKGQSYAKSLEKFAKPQDHLTEWLLDGNGNKIYTQPNMLGYLIDLEVYIQSKPSIKFYNTSRAGAKITGTIYTKNA